MKKKNEEEEEGQEGEQGRKKMQAQNIFHLDSNGRYWVKGQTKTLDLQEVSGPGYQSPLKDRPRSS